MLIDERDERLIQKCVDQELSGDETRELLERLDALDSGWKLLACGLLEDRSLRRLIGSPVSCDDSRRMPDTTGRDVRPMVASQSKARAVARHWWSHPLTSLTLCAAIAFVGGILIPDRSPPATGVASNRASEAVGNPSQPLAQTAGYGTYQLQMTPGGQTLEVPIYGQLQELFQRDRNNPLFSTSRNGDRQGVRWLLVPVEGNRSMLIPVSEDTPLNMQ